jgi:hypothetical protein
MKKEKSRREFLKLTAVASGAAIMFSSKKSHGLSKSEEVEGETLYRETEHFKKYYETLK